MVKKHNLGPLKTALLPYMKFNGKTGMFEALTSASLGWSTTLLETSLLNCVSTIRLEDVSVDAANRGVPMDTSLQFIVQLLFKVLEDVVKKEYLYKCSEADQIKWKELRK